MSDSATTLNAACQAPLSSTISQSLLKCMSMESVMPSNHHPLSSPYLPALNLSQHQGLFQWLGSSNQVAKVLELQLQHHSFYEYSGLISFRIDWFDLLSVQGTLKSLLQHHNSKASVLQQSYHWLSMFETTPGHLERGVHEMRSAGTAFVWDLSILGLSSVVLLSHLSHYFVPKVHWVLTAVKQDLVEQQYN